MTDTLAGMKVNNGEILSPAVGNAALKSTAADGSSIEVNSSGKLQVKAAGLTAAMSSYAAGHWEPGTLTASDAAAGILSYLNPEAAAWLVTDLIIKVDTGTSGACTADFGTAATNISADNLLDGVDLAVAGIYRTSTLADLGTNGVTTARLPASGYLTGSMATGATAGLAGSFLAFVIQEPT